MKTMKFEKTMELLVQYTVEDAVRAAYSSARAELSQILSEEHSRSVAARIAVGIKVRLDKK